MSNNPKEVSFDAAVTLANEMQARSQGYQSYHQMRNVHRELDNQANVNYDALNVARNLMD